MIEGHEDALSRRHVGEEKLLSWEEQRSRGSEARTSDPAVPAEALDVLRPCDLPLAGRGWAVTVAEWGNGLIKNMPVKSSSVQGCPG